MFSLKFGFWNIFFYQCNTDLLGDDHVPTTVTGFIKKEPEGNEITQSPGTRQIYQSPSMSVSIHEVPVSSNMSPQHHQHQHHSHQQRDHGIASNLNVLAALANNSHHNNLHNNQHPHVSFSSSSGDQHQQQQQQQRGHGHSTSMINPTANEKAIAQAIAAVGGNFPNHSPPPYPGPGDNPNSGGGSANPNSNNNNSGAHPNGSNVNGGHGYITNISPPLRYPYPSGRHQQVNKLHNRGVQLLWLCLLL